VLPSSLLSCCRASSSSRVGLPRPKQQLVDEDDARRATRCSSASRVFRRARLCLCLCFGILRASADVLQHTNCCSRLPGPNVPPDDCYAAAGRLTYSLDCQGGDCIVAATRRQFTYEQQEKHLLQVDCELRTGSESTITHNSNVIFITPALGDLGTQRNDQWRRRREIRIRTPRCSCQCALHHRTCRLLMMRECCLHAEPRQHDSSADRLW
jgi:hypothetical protein